jgi:hypothetical protein
MNEQLQCNVVLTLEKRKIMKKISFSIKHARDCAKCNINGDISNCSKDKRWEVEGEQQINN